MLSVGHEYFLNLVEKGQSPQQAASNVEFDLGTGNSYFVEIAKFGALRLLWNTLLHQYGVENGYATIHARTSNFYLSNLDIHNNLLRATTAAMASSIAGAESIEVLPYDHNLAEKFSDGHRLARNIQLLLQEESYFNQVKDAAAGSYYIDQLTDILIEKGWNFFQQIDRFENFNDAVDQGFITTTIQADVKQKKALFNDSELKLVGVNFQPNSIEERTENEASENLAETNRLAQFNA
jgi:methylmalonyl-CoA mutase